MESIWEGKTKPRRPSKHILAGQLLKTTWISNRGFPWNNNSKGFNGQRHPDLISAADQMPCKQETADTQLSPITYSALSMKGLLFTASKLSSPALLYSLANSLFCPLKAKRKAGFVHSVPARRNRAGMSGGVQPTRSLQGCSAAQALDGKPQNTQWLISAPITSSWNMSLKVSKPQLLHQLK